MRSPANTSRKTEESDYAKLFSLEEYILLRTEEEEKIKATTLSLYYTAIKLSPYPF
jgi:hypothetical protein